MISRLNVRILVGAVVALVLLTGVVTAGSATDNSLDLDIKSATYIANAEALGLAGAYTAMAGGIDGVLHNPAGLISAKGLQLALNFRPLSDRVSIQQEVETQRGDEADSGEAADSDEETRVSLNGDALFLDVAYEDASGITSFGAAYSLQGSALDVAFGVYWPRAAKLSISGEADIWLDYERDMVVERNGMEYPTVLSADGRLTVTAENEMAYHTPAVAVAAGNNWVSAGLNIVPCVLQLDADDSYELTGKNFRIPDPNSATWETVGVKVEGYDLADSVVFDTGSFAAQVRGFALRPDLGFMLFPKGWFSLGASVENLTGSRLTMRGQWSASRQSRLEDEWRLYYEGEDVYLEANNEEVYSGGSQSRALQIPLPQTLNLGAALKTKFFALSGRYSRLLNTADYLGAGDGSGAPAVLSVERYQLGTMIGLLPFFPLRAGVTLMPAGLDGGVIPTSANFGLGFVPRYLPFIGSNMLDLRVDAGVQLSVAALGAAMAEEQDVAGLGKELRRTLTLGIRYQF